PRPLVGFPGMDQLLPNLGAFLPALRATVMLDGCGHWTQQERPDEVSERLIAFCRDAAAAQPGSRRRLRSARRGPGLRAELGDVEHAGPQPAVLDALLELAVA